LRTAPAAVDVRTRDNPAFTMTLKLKSFTMKN
jgi:hypothetical protein